MAATKTKTNTKKGKVTKTAKSRPNRTHKPKHTSWQDELGIGYATYDHEEDYTSPATIDEEDTNLIRSFNQRLAIAPIFVDEDS